MQQLTLDFAQPATPAKLELEPEQATPQERYQFQKLTRPQPIGRAWISNAVRPIYGMREIKSGKKKGKIEVTYLKSFNNFATVKIDKTDIKKLFNQEGDQEL